MGGQYSLGTAPVELEKFSRISRLEGALSRFRKHLRKTRADDPGHFMTYADFRVAFPLKSKEAAHKCFTKYFQRSDDDDDGDDGGGESGAGRTAIVAEVFGALVLSCMADQTTKIRFLFDLHDRDRDRRLNRIELHIALETACQGLARLFRNPYPPPSKLVGKLVEEIFGAESTRLNAEGDVDATSVMAWVAADKRCMKYFANLESGSFDLGAMVRRQEKLLLELAEIDARIAGLDHETDLDLKGADRYVAERGGDLASGLLRVGMAVDEDPLERGADALRLYSDKQPQPMGKIVPLPAHNDMRVFGGLVEP
eukprot:CAMPEP_0172636036 /NCGR_PEP_ID=MMETSP1068-20121228/202141_1 /TAXON_ID=35684 /ORGANISM="Pseudopedinella elastica, Strain CCMP716" /LENGTH=311 /DNA_ID=CAMNT_0013448393 /DNA_START=92 /DNA_END=1023 /DNA_ORIENTATION=+